MSFAAGSDHHFHSLFKFSPKDPEVLIIGIHVPSAARYKNTLWNDFANNLPPSSTPCNFSDWVDEAGLVDLGYNGPAFTWNNGRDGMELIRERLDRALANAAWLDLNPHTQIFATNQTSQPRTVSFTPNAIVDVTDRELLASQVSKLEVKQALNSMMPMKSPGPDGIQPIFFQNNWDVVGDSIFRLVLESFVWGKIHQTINESFIALIPKTDKPSSMNEFRPIGLWSWQRGCDWPLLMRKGYVKLNTDGAWRNNGLVAAGCVIRGDSVAAEHRCIIVETDASALKNTIEEFEKYGMSELSVILKDIEELLKAGNEVQFGFVPREANFWLIN
uniref:RNase H type-1 domain-containing protein n=1 Tax=Chenopodium quinoa TaxID=63459 RepID=A0A803MJW8_CHEQI